MPPAQKLKSIDFFRKIPKELTEASFSGAGLSVLAAVFMIFLFGMELNDFLSVGTTTTVVVDNSEDSDFLRIDFNFSFPALSCEFASVDISDVLGTNRLNLTKTVRKYPIDANLKPIGSSEFESASLEEELKHDEEIDEEHGEGSVPLNGRNFDRVAHGFPLLVVNFYAPWCSWSNRLKPAWEKAGKIMRDRYDLEMDGRILLAKVDCTVESALCRRHHVQGYPSIRIFRNGDNVRDDSGNHEHESYYGHRDTDSLVKTMDELVASLSTGGLLALDGNVIETKRPAPKTGGCRVEGFVRVKRVPGNLVVSARSAAHSFDASQMNMSHLVTRFSFGRIMSPKERSDIIRLLPWIRRTVGRMDGLSYVANPSESNANVTIEHYIQAVKTEVRTKSYKLLEEHAYTAHHSLVNSIDIPVAKFHFELSPMQVLIEEYKKSFTHFITYICAIIGGVYTVAGILDSIFHNGVSIVKKMELGKNF